MRERTLRSFGGTRFHWSAAIVLTLLVTASTIGWQNCTFAKAEQEKAQIESRKSWENQGSRNPHSAAHFGVYAYKPKMPRSLVDSGLDTYTGTNIWVEAHYQNPARGRPIEDATALQRFGELKAAVVGRVGSSVGFLLLLSGGLLVLTFYRLDR